MTMIHSDMDDDCALSETELDQLFGYELMCSTVDDRNPALP